MALASQVPAITGKLRKRLILDLSVALGGGTVAGYGYWYVTHRMAYSFFYLNPFAGTAYTFLAFNDVSVPSRHVPRLTESSF